MPEYLIEKVRKKAEDCLTNHKVTPEDARILIDHMITADMRGRSSHGLSVRLKMIIQQAKAGKGNIAWDITADNGSTMAINGNNGFGYLQGGKALDLLTERVQNYGLASVALRNTCHTGMLGYYTARGAEAGAITMAFGNCCPLMAPYGGARALLGTNPLSFGFPAPKHPIVVDMGTGAVTAGERLEKLRTGGSLPPDCALDADGKPTTDPHTAAEGCLLAFGGHRGGALAVAVQLLAGVTTGSPAIPPKGEGYGLLLIGLRPGLFGGEKHYNSQIANFIEKYRAVPDRDGFSVRLPGSDAYKKQWETERRGTIFLSDEIAELLRPDA